MFELLAYLRICFQDTRTKVAPVIKAFQKEVCAKLKIFFLFIGESFDEIV